MTFDDLAVGDVMYLASKKPNGGTHVSYEEIVEIGAPEFGKRKIRTRDCETGKPRTWELGSMIRYHPVSGGPKLLTAGSIEKDNMGRRIWKAEAAVH